MQPDRVLVIALDGATYDLMLPWVMRGLLPHLGSIMHEGVYGDLHSVLPTESDVAWRSFATGMNPGKHGLFGRYAPAGDVPSERGRDATIHTLDAWLHRAGKRVLTIDAPFAAEDGAVQLAFGPAAAARDPQTFLHELHDATDRLVARAQQQMRRTPWAFCMVRFTGVELVQHYFYRRYERRARFGDAIRDYYQKIDEAVGALLADAQETTVFVISDHGMRPFEQHFCLNTWLHHHGWLAFQKPLSNWLKRHALHVANHAGLHARLLHAHEQRERSSDADPRHPIPGLEEVNFPATRAYAYGTGCIRLNVRGREQHGLIEPDAYEREREALIAALQAVTDTSGRAPAFSGVYRREELYAGPHLSNAPDIIVTSDRYHLNDLARFGSVAGLYGGVLQPSLHVSGMHASNGIFMARGPHIRAGQSIERARIVDLAPTILYHMGAPVPPGMDGRVLTEIFTEHAGRNAMGQPSPPRGQNDTSARDAIHPQRASRSAP